MYGKNNGQNSQFIPSAVYATFFFLIFFNLFKSMQWVAKNNGCSGLKQFSTKQLFHACMKIFVKCVTIPTFPSEVY